MPTVSGCLSISSLLTMKLASRYAIRFGIKPVAGYRTSPVPLGGPATG